MSDNTARSWVLTDVARDIYVERWEITGGSADLPPGTWKISKRRLLGGRRDGVDIVEVDNGSMAFSVLATRGMGLWRGRYRDWPLGWQAPVAGPVHPAYVSLTDRHGLGWLDGFDEWICRCGLHSHGPPGTDPQTGEFLTLHGRIANLPAHYLEVQVVGGAAPELRVIGHVDEVTLFFDHLRLISEIVTQPGSPRVLLRDRVQNLRSAPADLEMLYHCQFGPPLLEEGSRFVAPVALIAARDRQALPGIHRYDRYQGPTPGFAEEVYFFDLLCRPSGDTLVLLHNAAADRGVSLRFNKRELPYFVLWKNTGALRDGYVTGLEPALNLPNFKAVEREKGRLVTLQPGGQWSATIVVEIHEGLEAVRRVLADIAELQRLAEPTVHTEPGWPDR